MRKIAVLNNKTMTALIDQFSNHKFINIETYRKTGQAMPTPVWFVEHDGKLYLRTINNAGKVKRIRNNPKVRVMPCGQRGEPRGEWVDATARVQSDDEDRLVNTWFMAKYGIMKRFFDLMNSLRRSKWQAVEVTLA